MPGAWAADFAEEAKVKTLLHSIAVLEEWLQENEGTTQNEVRIRRMKRWREEAEEQLRLEQNQARP